MIPSPMIYENFLRLGPMLIEYKPYGKEDSTPLALSVLIERVQLLAALLKSSKTDDFCALKCVHWFRQVIFRRYG